MQKARVFPVPFVFRYNLGMGKNQKKRYYPPYRHQELYEWNEDYQRHKFFTEKDYAAERRIWKQKRRGNMDDPDYSPPWGTPQFRYEDRYGSLKQDTIFFKNICKLDEMRRRCGSWPEFSLKCAAENIEECKVRFYLLYLWFSKARWFGYPENYWSYLEDRRRLSEAEIMARYPAMQLADAENCCSYDDIRRQAFAGGHKACRYARFVEREL